MHSTRADIYKHPNVCAYCHPVGLCFSLWWLLFPCFRDKTQTARRTTTLVVPCPVLRAQMDPILIAVLNLTPGKFLLQEEALGGLHTLIISRYRKVGPFMGQCQCLWPTLSWSCCWGGRCTADSSLEVKGQQPNGWQSKRQTQGQHVGRAKTKVHVLSPLRAPHPPKSVSYSEPKTSLLWPWCCHMHRGEWPQLHWHTFLDTDGCHFIALPCLRLCDFALCGSWASVKLSP